MGSAPFNPAPCRSIARIREEAGRPRASFDRTRGGENPAQGRKTRQAAKDPV
jgi:hypothetical protein